MTADAKETGTVTPPTPYSFDNVFKLWSKYEDVTMHFNELILRLRFQALAGVASLSALAGVFGREIDASIRSTVLSGVFALLAFFWLAIWALDRFYCDRLLTGAVHALLKIERMTHERPSHLEIDFSSAIERSFLREIEPSRKPAIWKDGRNWFYTIVLVALLSGVVFHVWPLIDWLVGAIQSPQPPPPF